MQHPYAIDVTKTCKQYDELLGECCFRICQMLPLMFTLERSLDDLSDAHPIRGRTVSLAVIRLRILNACGGNIFGIFLSAQ